MTMMTLTTCVDGGSVDGMALLTGRHPDEPLTVVTLGLRAAWLHMAVTGPGAAMLTSRDRDALALTATSAYGVPADAIVRYLRRGGASPTAALACVRRLVIEVPVLVTVRRGPRGRGRRPSGGGPGLDRRDRPADPRRRIGRVPILGSH